jgi:PAS domain S-box-containing protein
VVSSFSVLPPSLAGEPGIKGIKVRIMSGIITVPTGENHFRLTNTELQHRIVLLEEALLEKEQTGAALQDSEKRYRRLFESAHDGILILDADTGKVVDVNPFLLQLLGFSYEELCGQYIWELGVFKDIAASQEAFKILQDAQYIRYEDLPLETRDGRPTNPVRNRLHSILPIQAL